jgi:hypothetical protein
MDQERLDNLRDFFVWQISFICQKWSLEIDKEATRSYYRTIAEDIVEFFNENNPEDYDMRDCWKVVKRIDEI